MLRARVKSKGSREVPQETANSVSTLRLPITPVAKAAARKKQKTVQQKEINVTTITNEISNKEAGSDTSKTFSDQQDKAKLQNLLKRKGFLSTSDATLMLEICSKLV